MPQRCLIARSVDAALWLFQAVPPFLLYQRKSSRVCDEQKLVEVIQSGSSVLLWTATASYLLQKVTADEVE